MRRLGGGAERIGLSDQPRQFRQRIALGPIGGMRIAAAAIVVMGGIRSVLVSISHRDDASPSTGAKSYDKRMVTRHMPRHIPMCAAFTPSLPHLGWSVDAENGETRCQNRDDALNHRQARPRDLCMIIDNEA